MILYSLTDDGTLDRLELRKALESSLQGSVLDTTAVNATKLADILFDKVKAHRSEQSPGKSW